jgi:hypothetical protein
MRPPLLALASSSPDMSLGLADAARLLLPHLERGQRIDAIALRYAMECAFGGSDAPGAWDWKAAYDACEAAAVLFLRKFGPAVHAQAASPAGVLKMLSKVASLLPTHTRRSQESRALIISTLPCRPPMSPASAARSTRRQVRGSLGLRVPQAAVLLSPDHLDEDADPTRGDRA